MKDGRLKEDLRVRTRMFAGRVVRVFRDLPPRREDTRILGRQLLRSGTSVAAQYREACRFRSDAELVSKLECCIQEADETELWLDLLATECAIDTPEIIALRTEVDELIAMFVTAVKRLKSRR